MKTLLLILVTAGITFASAYLIVNNQQAGRAKEAAAAQAQWQTEKASLESALASARSQPSTTIFTPAANTKSTRLSAKDILDKLVAVKPGSGAERNRNIRLVVYYLESLTACGAEALPVIKDFLAQNQDIDYTTEEAAPADANASADQNQNGQNGNNNRGRNRNNNGGNNIFQFRRGGELRTDFVVPPSLRLGLVDVLKSVGGTEAETILASVLESTGRGIEVDYVAKVLQEMTPDKYRLSAISAAKDLLMHPLTVDNPNRADDLSKSYLYDVLKMYNDTSFATEAQTLLVGADGRLDRDALNYLNSVLKEQAIPALYSAYNNPNLTNQGDKINIGRDLLGYVGDNSTANQFFNDILKNPDLDNRIKTFTIAALAGGGGGGFGGGGNNNAQLPTPQQVTSRVRILNGLLPQYADDLRTTQIINATVDALNSGQPVDFRAIFGGGNGRRQNGGGNQAQGQGN